MARVVFNRNLERVSGKTGSLVFKQRGTTRYISKVPDFSERKLSDVQKASNDRFWMAVSYAKAARQDPELYREIKARAMITGRSVYHQALSEWRGKRSSTGWKGLDCEAPGAAQAP